MNNFNENINKYKKYAFRKIGKYFGPCVIGTMISLGVAVTVPSNNAHASQTAAGGAADIENISSASDGYEVIIPKGKKYIRNDEIESHTPVLKEEGYNGRSFIVPSENYGAEYPPTELFTKLYDKDADTLSITFTKLNSTEKETIVTKKDNGTWKIEKAPKGVTINPTNGLVYIPIKEIEPKTPVDTLTEHKKKPSKIVSVIPNIRDLKEFVGTTEWIDVNGNVLKRPEKGVHEKEKFASYVWLESILEGDKITHIYFEGTPIVEKPEYKITVWFDKDGNPIKPNQPGNHESGEIPGYKFVTTTTTDGITTHTFEKIIPVDPNKPTPENLNRPIPEIPGKPTPDVTKTPDVVPGKLTEKQQVKRLANTGTTETNTGLAGLGLAMFGMALTSIKRRKEK